MEELDFKYFGYRLRAIRSRTSVTLKQLSEASGVSLNTIARIERGEIDPRMSTAYKICHAFNDLRHNQ